MQVLRMFVSKKIWLNLCADGEICSFIRRYLKSRRRYEICVRSFCNDVQCVNLWNLKSQFDAFHFVLTYHKENQEMFCINKINVHVSLETLCSFGTSVTFVLVTSRISQ